MEATTGTSDAPAAGFSTAQSENTRRAQLRAAGLRATKQRLAVLDIVEQRPHSTAGELVDAVRATLPDITVQSIYVVTQSLITAGLVRKVELPNSPARYELEAHDNHHHAVCRYCGRIEDVACATGKAPCLHPAGRHTMTIDVAEVVYHAVCPDCALEAEDTYPHR